MRKIPAYLVSSCDSLHEHPVTLVTDSVNAYVYGETDVTDVWAADDQPANGTLIVLATCSQPLNADDRCEARVTWSIAPRQWGSANGLSVGDLSRHGAPLRNLTYDTADGQVLLNLTALASALVTVHDITPPTGDPFWGGAAMMWRTLTGARTDAVALQEARAILATPGNVTARVVL